MTKEFTKQEDELGYIKKYFPHPTVKQAFNVFERSMQWNNVNGVEISNFILENCRLFNFGKGKMIFDLRAHMQSGKSKAILSALAVLAKEKKELDLTVVYYLCSSNTDLVKQFKNDADSFFSELGYDVDLSQHSLTAIDFCGEQSIKILFCHNTSSKKDVKSEIVRQARHSMDSSNMVTVLLFDESDQALGRDSNRDEFVKQIINFDNPYCKEALVFRQNKKILELGISATGFLTNFVAKKEFENIFASMQLRQHPEYYGLRYMAEEGYFLSKKENEAKDVILSWVENSQEYTQLERPVAFMRLTHGNKRSRAFFENNVQSLPFRTAFCTDEGSFWSAIQDDQTEIIVCHYNNTSLKYFVIESFLKELSRKARIYLDKYQNFHSMNKKVLFLIDGTLKEGNNLLNKHGPNISFLWESITENTKKTEGPIQQAGRVCNIGNPLPPLLYSDTELADIIENYINEDLLPSGSKIRRCKNSKQSRLNNVEDVFIKYSDGKKDLKSVLLALSNYSHSLRETPLRRYGSFKSKSHSSRFRDRVYPAIDYYIDKLSMEDLSDKTEINKIYATGMGARSSSVAYINQNKEDGLFYFCFVKFFEESDEYFKNLAKEDERAYYLKYTGKANPIELSVPTLYSDVA